MHFYFAMGVKCGWCGEVYEVLITKRGPSPTQTGDVLEARCSHCGRVGSFGPTAALRSLEGPDSSLPEARWIRPPGGR
jgi:hypothetical protein